LKGEIAALGVQVIAVPAGTVEARVAAYSRNPNVEYAEPNYIAYAIGTPNDPYFGNQWGMTKIQAPDAWDVTTGSSGVKIAILDTGIDQDHEDLASKIVSQENFTDSPTLDDLYGHGTHVAGIAAAATNNGKGVAGVGYNSSLLNVKVLNDQGSGYYSWVANGIIWAADKGAAKVINMSLGGSVKSTTLENAVNYAWGKGVVLAAAAGNSGSASPLYPAYYKNCIAVAATDENDAKASWSSFGKWVDVAAPGVNIFSTFPNHPYVIDKSLGYDYGSGTSMATPHVAGLAALVWATGYGSSNASVRSRIESTADKIPGTGKYWIWGRINAYNAVK
jgi:thermitase